MKILLNNDNPNAILSTLSFRGCVQFCANYKGINLASYTKEKEIEILIYIFFWINGPKPNRRLHRN